MRSEPREVSGPKAAGGNGTCAGASGLAPSSGASAAQAAGAFAARRIRVAVLGHRLDRPEAALAAGLARRGLDVVVVCDAGSNHTSALADAGVKLRTADLHRGGAAALEVLRAVLERDRPDIVHVLTSRALRAARRVRAALGDARIVYYRGKIDHPRRWHPADRRKYMSGFVDRFFTVSHAVGRALVAGGVAQERVRTIYKAHDSAWYDVPAADVRQELGLEPGRFVAAVVANMRAEKGIDETLAAARQLVAEGCSAAWVLIGRDERRPLARRLRPLEIPGVTYPLGFRADVASLLRSADCFVNASRTEGLPKAVIEAMFCGVPVVATAIGGNAELVRDGVSGLLVPPRSPRAIAAAVRRLYDDAALRTGLARAARDWAERELSVDRMVGATIDLYAELIGAAEL